MSCCTLSTKKRLAVCSAQLFALNCWGVGTWVQGWFPRLCSPHSQQLLASTSPIANSTTLLFCGCLLFACINLFRVHTKLATASQSIVSFSTVQLLACKCSLPSMILYMFWHCSCSWLGCTNSRTPDRLRHVHPFCDFEGLGKKRRKLGWDVLSCENFVYTELALEVAVEPLRTKENARGALLTTSETQITPPWNPAKLVNHQDPLEVRRLNKEISMHPLRTEPPHHMMTPVHVHGSFSCYSHFALLGFVLRLLQSVTPTMSRNRSPGPPGFHWSGLVWPRSMALACICVHELRPNTSNIFQTWSRPCQLERTLVNCQT